jgi:mRNA interferase MazF
MINTITPVITTETRERRVNKNIVTRGDIILVDLPNVGESVQTGRRPAIVVQNNMGNAHSPCIIVVPITNATKKYVPTHVKIGVESGLLKTSTVLCEQLLTINKSSVIKTLGHLTPNVMKQIEQAIYVSLALHH